MKVAKIIGIIVVAALLFGGGYLVGHQTSTKTPELAKVQINTAPKNAKPEGVTTVSDLISSQSKYDGKEVKVAGALALSTNGSHAILDSSSKYGVQLDDSASSVKIDKFVVDKQATGKPVIVTGTVATKPSFHIVVKSLELQ